MTDDDDLHEAKCRHAIDAARIARLETALLNCVGIINGALHAECEEHQLAKLTSQQRADLLLAEHQANKDPSNVKTIYRR